MEIQGTELEKPPDANTITPLQPATLCCPKCDKVFVREIYWKKHVDNPPAYCLTEQARRRRTQSVATRNPLDKPQLRRQLAALCQTMFLPDHIPKTVRRLVAEALRDRLKAVSTENTVSAWEDLLLFPYLTLGQPKSSPDERTESLPQIIRGNLRADHATALVDLEPQLNARHKKPLSDGMIVKQVARKIQDGNLSGAVRTLIAADSIIPSSEETLSILRSKHPFGVPVIASPPEGPLAPFLSPEEIYDGIFSFPNGSAAGPDGMRPQYLKEMLVACSYLSEKPTPIKSFDVCTSFRSFPIFVARSDLSGSSRFT